MKKRKDLYRKERNKIRKELNKIVNICLKEISPDFWTKKWDDKGDDK